MVDTGALRPYEDAVAVPLVVQLHHELVEVAEVEDDRHATLRVNLDTSRNRRSISGPPD